MISMVLLANHVTRFYRTVQSDVRYRTDPGDPHAAGRHGNQPLRPPCFLTFASQPLTMPFPLPYSLTSGTEKTELIYAQLDVIAASCTLFPPQVLSHFRAPIRSISCLTPALAPPVQTDLRF